MRQEKDEAYQKSQAGIQELANARREKQKLAIEVRNLQEEHKIGGDVAGGSLSYAALQEKNRELERDVKILEAQKTLIVQKNPEFGTFEYLGEPVSLTDGLRNDEMPGTSAEVVALMKKWV